jgi:hypothetical protein
MGKKKIKIKLLLHGKKAQFGTTNQQKNLLPRNRQPSFDIVVFPIVV